MDEPTDRAGSDPARDRHVSGPRNGRPGRRLPAPARQPADTRRTDPNAWRGRSDSLYSDPYRWFQRRILFILGSVALTCGVVSLVTLGADAPSGWELALRLLSTALVATSVALCVLAVRHRYPQRWYVSYPLLAVAALVAAAAVMGVAVWTTA